MAAFHFAIPGDLAAPTGGYAYARQVLQALPWLNLLPLPDGFPWPDETSLRGAARLLADLPKGDVVLIDGLAFGAMPETQLAPIQATIAALVHHPLCLETGLSADDAARFHHVERQALARAWQVIATSVSTAGLLHRSFDVPLERLIVAEPGTDRSARAARAGGGMRLLAVGAVTPRKGYRVLVEALSGLGDHDWQMAIVGDLGRDPSEVALLRASLAHHGLEQRVTLLGAVSDAALEAHYAEADIFVSASFHEGYGMAVARALAHGLPIVSTNSGALADTIPPGASVVCAAGDAVALRDAIARLRGDHDLRRHCAEMSWHAGQALPGWDITATTIAAVLRACGSGQV